MTIVVVGDLMADVVAALPGELAVGSDTPAAIEHHHGGSGANVAAWLASEGAPVTFVGRAGADPLGDAAVEALRAAGVAVEVARDVARPTGTCIVLVHPGGERTMVPDPGANDALSLDGLPGGDHLHVTGYGLLREGSRAAVLRALELARGRGMTVSVDPSSAAPLAALGAARFLEWTAGAGLLLPNADEARVLTGEEDPERAACALARPARAAGDTSGAAAREVVVTLGAGGALWTDGSAVARAPAERATVVDTTGAGDAFAAGLLAARMRGAGPAEALAAGCRVAARAVGVTGARPTGYD
jgi:sugar/nucleoside kinase (ribokinase family)